MRHETFENYEIDIVKLRRPDTWPTPSLLAISWHLRRPATWPPGFEWDYRYALTCAYGLMTRLWPGAHISPEVLGISESDYCHIISRAGWVRVRFFGLPLWWKRVPMKQVTPEMVADVIDAMLARKTRR